MTIRGINRAPNLYYRNCCPYWFAVTESKINKGMSFIFIFLWTKKKRWREGEASKQEKKAVD